MGGVFSITSRLNTRGFGGCAEGGYEFVKEERRRARAWMDGGDEGEWLYQYGLS